MPLYPRVRWTAPAIAVIACMLLSLPIAALEPEILSSPHAYVETGAFFVTGTAQEIVYKSNDSDNTDKKSLLIYPIPPSLGAYAAVDVRWLPFLDTRLAIDTAWALTTGNLTDDDWISVPDTDDPQLHSDSTGFMTSYLNVDFRVSFPLSADIFVFEPLVGFSYSFGSWEGWNAVHSEYGGPPINLYGQVLDYRQTWVTPYLGFNTGISFHPISVTFGLHASPYSYTEDRDIHILPRWTFLDYMQGGWMLSPRFDIELSLSAYTALTIAAVYKTAQGVRGDIIHAYNGYSTEDTAYVRSINQAGAGMERFTVSVGVRVGMEPMSPTDRY